MSSCRSRATSIAVFVKRFSPVLSRRRGAERARVGRAMSSLALQLQFDIGSDSMPHHDWGIMDGGWIGRGDVGAVGVVVAGGQGSDQAVVPAGADGGLGRAVPRCLAWP